MEVRVIKSKRKSLCLSIGRNGEVLVRAPLYADDREIENFVMRHGRWIASRLEKMGTRKTLSLGDGNEIVLFGDRYVIEEGKAEIQSGKLFLPLSGRERAFLRLLKIITGEKMSALVNRISFLYGFEYSGLRISSARTRWGSCNRARILSFTCFLAFVEPALADYVAVHELCHTRYFNHGKEFWREVEKILPDWRVRRAKLRQEEDCLNYLR